MSRNYDQTFDEITAEVRTRYPALPLDRIEEIVRVVLHGGPHRLWHQTPGVRAFEIPHRLQKLEAEEPVMFVGARH